MSLSNYVDLNQLRGKNLPTKVVRKLMNNPEEVELSVIYSLDFDDPVSSELRSTTPDLSEVPYAMNLQPYPQLAFLVKKALQKIDKATLANNSDVSINLITRVSNGKALLDYGTASRILESVSNLVGQTDSGGEVLLPELQSEESEASIQDGSDFTSDVGGQLLDQ